MAKMTFRQKKWEVEKQGIYLEKDQQYGCPYCVWVNSPTGSKEIWCKNFAEVNVAVEELKAIVATEGKNFPPTNLLQKQLVATSN